MKDQSSGDQGLYRKIHALVSVSLFGQLTSEDGKRLEYLLRGGPQARRIYFDYLSESAMLRSWATQPVVEPTVEMEEAANRVRLEEIEEADRRSTDKRGKEHAACEADFEIPRHTRQEVADRPESDRPGGGRKRNYYYYAAVGVMAALLIVSFSLIFRNSHPPAGNLHSGRQGPDQITSQGVPGRQDGEAGRSPPAEGEQFVARVVHVSPDASWIDGQAPNDFLFRLVSNERVVIATGLAEIEFASQARVILHGPSALLLLGPDSARLEHGRLTGQVEKGEFRLEAGVAEVIDLGTEFGVAVDNKSGTDVCVFDGEMDVRARSKVSQSVESHRLTEGMSVRVESDGTVGTESSTDADLFVRRIFSPGATDERPKTLTLIDMISGGDGRGRRMAGAINPMTGDWDRYLYKDPLLRNQESDGVYHACVCSDLIDGVFIPQGSSGEVEIDSTRSRIVLESTDGNAYGPIWVRRKSPLSAPQLADSDFWGTGTLIPILNRLADAQTGIMGIHPNVGITFDLLSIRNAQRRIPSRFQATLANLDNAEEFAPHEVAAHPRRSADVRILVDGRPRYSRLDFTRQDGESFIDVELDERDRFLTILSTDAGNENVFDHIVLVDPEFILH